VKPELLIVSAFILLKPDHHGSGYQVMKGGRLRALVGGNARFGGLFDLASISRDDGRENTVVRFAVIRRERLGVRFV